MKIFVLNSGSSSIKYQLLEMPEAKLLAKGLIEKIGLGFDESIITHKSDKGNKKFTKKVEDHSQGIKEALGNLIDDEIGVIKSYDEIDAVGHRVVHGGEHFDKSVIITDEVIKIIDDLSDLAPLHNPPNLLGIKASFKVLGDKPNVAVFDTAFHQTMPKEAFLYGFPYEYYEKMRIRRYGFHGTSHHFVAKAAAEFLKKPLEELKLINCHLGNGSSVCAIKYGKSIETSMGFTPLAGLIMGTRTGDVDPSTIFELIGKKNIPVDELNNIANKKSGLLGLSGFTSDFREIEEEYLKGNERAEITIKTLVRSIVRYIGAYAAVMNGVDAIIFTAGIGENQYLLRELVCKDITFLGFEFDFEKNKKSRGVNALLSTPESKTAVLLIPTNEELMIAEDTMKLIK